MPLAPGSRLGLFEIIGPLGAGGMGEVYRARDMRLGRDVALKVLPEAFARDPVRVGRFSREARMLASVNHPSIAAIYGAEEDGDTRYLVLELVPGDTLAEWMSRGPLSLDESLSFARQIAEALEAAHERGVVHRDLKPSNIKVTPDGKIKVLDLGLAKMMEEPHEETNLSNSPTMVQDHTRPGVILGTAEFMSPEQARGKAIDKRTDIWAFGCILFEMLCGHRAFSGETISDILAAILTKEPQWNALPPYTPARIRDLLDRCLEKDANQRLRDIGEARVEIERVLSGDSAPPRRSHRPRWRLAAALVIILAGGWIFLVQRHGAPSAGVGEKALVVLPAKILSDFPGGQLVGDGLVETLSVRLNQVPGIQVVTPGAAVLAADKNSDSFGAARSVGAHLVVRSSVVRNGEMVRIIYSVWNVQTRQEVAGGTVDGTTSDLFGMQDRLAENVAVALKLPAPSKKMATPVGLETASQQERYLEAVGLLQRYDRRDAVEKAVRILETLAGERPDSPLAQAALGRAALAMFDFTQERAWADRAFSAAEAAHRLAPALPEVEITLGETLLATGREKDAVESFRRALASQPGRYEALLGLGRALGASGQDQEAAAAFRRAIALQPGVFAAYNQLGAFDAGRGRFREAAQSFQTVTRLVPDSYRAFSNLGGVWTMGCDFSSALAAYRKALQLKPDDPDSASNLGLTQLWTGNFAEAVASLEKAARAAPNDYRVWANLGDAYRGARAPQEKTNAAFQRSLGLARDALKLNPKEAAAYSFVATDLAKTGHASEAGGQVQKALALDGKNPNVLSDAAIVAALSGRTDEAVAFLQRAVEAGYCRAIVARQPEFESLRQDSRYQSLLAARPAA